jgi:reactive chlorine resistance protein C
MTMNATQKVFETAARMDRLGVAVTRAGLIVVLLWIGGLKIFHYEGDGIVPFVANSPFMKFFYAYPAPEYKKHMNKEGELVPANREWQEKNHTYLFAYGLGSVIVLYGLLLCLHPWLPQAATLGSFLVFLMSFVTLSFLITSPECWVPALGSTEHGFPLLSGAGRLVVKDAIMMGAALVTMADSAKAYLRKRSATVSHAVPKTERNQNGLQLAQR